ncbi:DUF6284 family protein [Catenuloplanes atrovinosus]|uniref:Uncharacterized protein n=1 Tax=Catenuloplanes atrovinosus TaxID=137266 RepID=A0AAE3YTW9_9ACTN|nr:DUF6284 family protein [Catenuloplanes atrovinosus]MDR7279814.1 hypothetical protein [Catenuloplanes atrovinosus]
MAPNDWLNDIDGPAPAELAAIQAEQPLISAEVALLDAQIRVFCSDGGPTELDWHRLRLAEKRVAREALALHRRYPDSSELGWVA